MSEKEREKKPVWGVSRMTRVVLIVIALVAGLVLLSRFFPVYHPYADDNLTSQTVEFLRRLQARQVAHFEAHGHYLGERTWNEWPEGDFPGPEGVDWGIPPEGPWADLRERPRGPLAFKMRVRASQRPDDAEAGLLPAPPRGPWFVIQARADLNGDGVIWLMEISSGVPGSIYFENAEDY